MVSNEMASIPRPPHRVDQAGARLGREGYACGNWGTSLFFSMDNPLIGRPGEITGTRELVIDQFPYLVIYRILERRGRILAIFRTSQYWQAGFGRA